MSSSLRTLVLRVPRENESTPEQSAQLLGALSQAVKSPSFLKRLVGKPTYRIALELVLEQSQVRYLLTFPVELETYVHAQVQAAYPDVSLENISDPLAAWPVPEQLGQLHLAKPAYFPLKDYSDFRETDPLQTILSVLSKTTNEQRAVVQVLLSEPLHGLDSAAYAYLHPVSSDPRFKAPSPDGKRLIENKLSQPLLGVELRLAASTKELLRDLHQSLAVLNRPDGNSLLESKIWPWNRSRFWHALVSRHPFHGLLHLGSHLDTLNTKELASLWHLPNSTTKVPNLAWAAGGGFAEAPENLPIGTRVQEQAGEGLQPVPAEDKDQINFFASTTFQNRQATFGIKLTDRLRHMYVLGKSGSGKSTLLENMAVDDMRKGRGLAFIDPHGESAEALLNYVPPNRIQDVIYFNPADREYPIHLNILEVKNPDQAELVASGIVSIFHKLYGNSWGPRLEYILRNTLLTLTQVPGSTLPDVVRMLTQFEFRRSIYPKLTSPQLLSFWQNEFDRLDEKNRAEHTASILNKVGQFVQSPLIHGIISAPHSTIDLDEIMNTGKILIANVSQGRLGEDNAALLGAMLITKLQQAAMNRVAIPTTERPEFFLFVDEFQNFATDSFMKILSEARKYKLGLTLANQYIAQIPLPIQKAIFGNAGTVVSFILGAQDARDMSAEFGGVFTPEALTNLQKYEISLRMAIDGATSRPFLAHTLAPPRSMNQNKQKVIDSSRRRWAKKADGTKYI